MEDVKYRQFWGCVNDIDDEWYRGLIDRATSIPVMDWVKIDSDGQCIMMYIAN